MAYVGVLLAVVIDNAFQLLAPDRFGFQVAGPDLPLITAIYIGFRARDTRQLGVAIALGFFADSFSARPFGHFAFLYGAAAYFALRVRRYVPPDALVSHIVACLLCGLITAFFALLIAVVTVRGNVGAGFARSLAQAVVSAPLAPFVFGLWDKSRLFHKALGGKRYDFA